MNKEDVVLKKHVKQLNKLRKDLVSMDCISYKDYFYFNKQLFYRLKFIEQMLNTIGLVQHIEISKKRKAYWIGLEEWD